MSFGDIQVVIKSKNKFQDVIKRKIENFKMRLITNLKKKKNSSMGSTLKKKNSSMGSTFWVGVRHFSSLSLNASWNWLFAFNYILKFVFWLNYHLNVTKWQLDFSKNFNSSMGSTRKSKFVKSSINKTALIPLIDKKAI